MAAAPPYDRMRSLADLFAKSDHRLTLAEARRYISQFPQHYLGWKVAGACHEGLFEFDAAAKAMEKALRIHPGDAEGLGNLAKVYKDLGHLPDALATYRKAMRLRPDDTEILGKYLFLLNYFNAASPEETFREASRFGSLLSTWAAPERFTAWTPRLAGAALKVGLVSGDLGNHPVGFFLENVLQAIDPTKIEITLYPSSSRHDALTSRLQSHGHAWKPIFGLDDADAATLIHADGIEILVDLSGLSAWHRLGVFARKPAPIQMSWLGYFATTGLPEMDYLLADDISVPAAHENHFSETVIRLPHTRLCYGHDLLASAPAVIPAPAKPPGQVVFGCFQNLSKITPEVTALWARVMRELPQARMRIQNIQLASDGSRSQIVAQFQKNGIAADRLDLHGPTSFDAYLKAHEDVDLILDTFPFPGGTTTCEALWMGVPTLTLAGERLISRQGQSLLLAAGLGDWVAAGEDEFVAMAVSRAVDTAGLADLRQRLRAKVASSPLFDSQAFAGDLTQAWLDIASESAQPGLSHGRR